MSEPVLSDDGYWELNEGEWIPTEKQQTALQNGAKTPDFAPEQFHLAQEFSPLGKYEIKDKLVFMTGLFVVTLFSLFCWSLFRYSTSNVLDSIYTVKFNIAYILIAPIVWIGPMMVYWIYYCKEEGLPVRLFAFESLKESIDKRLILLMISIGLTLTGVEILMFLSRDIIILYSGIYGDAEIDFLWGPATKSIWVYLVIVFTNLFIVATVEEIFFRGFLQDQLSRVLSNWQSVFISSVIFGLAHLPIAIFIYELEGLQLTLAVINWIGIGLAFGYVYHITRNIWVTIFWHGIYNVTVSTIAWGFLISDSPSKGEEQFIWISSQILLSIALLMFIHFIRKPLEKFGRFRHISLE